MTLDATPPLLEPTAPPSTMRRDLISAYLASGMKVASWAVVSGLVYRFSRYDVFAVFVLARTTTTLLNYTTLGLAPAIVHYLASVTRPIRVLPELRQVDDRTLHYATPVKPVQTLSAVEVMSAAVDVAGLCGILGIGLTILYTMGFNDIHRPDTLLAQQVGEGLAWAFGTGVALKLASDAIGAILQVRNRISWDNFALAGTELLWIILVYAVVHPSWSFGVNAATCFCAASLVLLITRYALLRFDTRHDETLKGVFRNRFQRFGVIWKLMSFGMIVSIGQLADFLYAPTDLLLISHLLDLKAMSAYAPALQIDSGLLLLVGAIATTLLPKAASAFVMGRHDVIRKYYVRGTIVSFVLLAASAVLTYIMAPHILTLWLNDPMPATQAILPLVLIHTVVGGSSAVGRSILLGMGKVKPFTIAVLIAGVSNVVLSYCFVRFLGLGLNGIVLGTICAVVGRCAVWQPWYVWRALKNPN